MGVLWWSKNYLKKQTTKAQLNAISTFKLKCRASSAAQNRIKREQWQKRLEMTAMALNVYSASIFNSTNACIFTSVPLYKNTDSI